MNPKPKGANGVNLDSEQTIVRGQLMVERDNRVQGRHTLGGEHEDSQDQSGGDEHLDEQAL